MAYAIALVFGAVGAGLWIAGVRWIGRGEPWWFALGLVVAAAIYLTHGLGVEPPPELGVAFAGVGLFVVIGVGGAARWSWLLGAGWALHAVWDVAAPRVADLSYMPAWYAPACLGFDLVVATYLLSRPTRPASTDQLVGP
ncbi:MAG: hypothetical protein VX681_07605 [Myxococcota bacterium]|nr:hypothetical protein [Myxococcota bacterium]